jgi:endonuclease/exonuclease/phosphatase family metal-dependent hydrolase
VSERAKRRLADSETMSTAEFKLLTCNLFHDVPRFRHLGRRLDFIAAGVSAERPDVVALQEVSRSAAGGDVGASLSGRVNLRCASAPYRLDYARADGIGDGEYIFEEGLALMSRLEACAPVEVVKFDAQVRLEGQFAGHRYRLPDDRIAMRARYRISNGIELQVCVTHLTDSRETAAGVAIRLQQARELIAWLERAPDPSSPLLLAGDFNDVPDSQTIAAITGAGFLDLWQTAGSGPGFTNDRDDLDIESPYGGHNQRIDYLFFRPGRGCRSEIAKVRLFLDRPRRTPEGGWLWASDHAGLIATLRF